ncbi:hypothetical protein BH24DEI2_BH24DEI2_26550 [soil metagenome]
MRHRSSALLLVLSLTLALAQEGYYPSRDGLSWTYSNGDTQTLNGPREVGGRQVMVFLHSLEGQPVSEDYLVYEGGVFLLGTAAGGVVLGYTPPLTLYPPAPLEVGQTWKSTAKVGDLDISLSFEVLAVTGVQTPAGRFNALQIRQQTITSTGGQTFLDLFFVPSVGVVRTVTQDGTQVDLIEKNF